MSALDTDLAINRPDTRAELIGRLRPVFQARGYEGATLSALATAAGLGKASLYHHFPGGKSEMVQALLQESVIELQQQAFSRLERPGTPAERLLGFVEGFFSYTADGQDNCLVAVLAQGSLQNALGDAIAAQYEDWLGQLARVFQEMPCKPKRAQREAEQLLGELYGQLLLGRLCHRPELLRRVKKRLTRRFADAA